MDSDVIGVIEAAYRVDGDDEVWLRGLLEAARAEVDAGFGLFGFMLDARDLAQVKISSLVLLGAPPGAEAVVAQIQAALLLEPDQQRAVIGPKETAAELYARTHPVVTATQVIGEESWASTPGVRSWLAPFGMKDLLVIKAVDFARRGVLLAAPLPTPGRPRAREAALYGRLAAHVAAAHRVRRRMVRASSALEGAEAILSPSGTIEHATGAAREPDARASLRETALAIERARGPMRRRDGMAAVSMWTALAAGRWTLLDHFERDGRRYLVARRNDPTARSTLPLTHREQQVVGFAARGHSVKLIAYELGLGPSTVSEHLDGAMRKLGAATRSELSRMWISAQRFDVRDALGDEDDELAVAVDEVPPSDASALSEAELTVVGYVLDGRSNAQIAAARGTSPRTVANQVARIFKKLAVGSRAELAAWAAGSDARTS